jgi:hypothetical protein
MSATIRAAIEYAESRYGLPDTGDMNERLEHIRNAMADDLGRTDSDAARKMRRYKQSDLLFFIDYVYEEKVVKPLKALREAIELSEQDWGWRGPSATAPYHY